MMGWGEETHRVRRRPVGDLDTGAAAAFRELHHAVEQHLLTLVGLEVARRRELALERARC